VAEVPVLLMRAVMIAQLYSHGEFSAQQFEIAKNLVGVREPGVSRIRSSEPG
jgi:hypothetical protein